EPEKPAAPTYKTPAEAITAMDACIAPDVNCPAFDQLVSMGPTATKDLLAIVTDAAKDSRIKSAALKALVKAKDPAAAQPLYEAAKAEKNSLFSEDLVEAAAAYGDEAIFQDLTANYVKLG